MNKVLLITAFLFSACGSDEPAQPLTFGDAALLIAEPFCQRDIECGGRVEAALPSCIDSQIYQLCSGLWDCSAELLPDEEELVLQCSADLAVRECSAQLSSTCIEVIGLRQ